MGSAYRGNIGFTAMRELKRAEKQHHQLTFLGFLSRVGCEIVLSQYVVRIFIAFEIYKLSAIQSVKNKAVTYTSLLCV